MNSNTNLNPIFAHSFQSDEFFPPISPWTKLGGLVIVGTIGIAFTLAAILKYNVTIKTAATVRPSGEIRLVQAATTGTVRQINVKENQIVRQGDVLAYIDDSQLQTKKKQLEGNIQNDHLQLAQITTEIRTLNTQQTFELSLMNHYIGSARADLSRNQRDYQEKKVATDTDVQEAEADVELARVTLQQYHLLSKTGAIAQLQIKEKEEAFKVALAKLRRAAASRNPSAAPVIIATEQIAQARAKSNATIATLNKEREDLQSKQIQIQNQLSSDVKELQQLEIEIGKTLILAPYTGTILKLNLRNSGQVVSPEGVIAQIAPSNAPFAIKARVAPQDIGKVQLCQQHNVFDCKQGKVQLRVSAYPYPDYGTLKGAVRAIAPDTTTPQSSEGSATAPPYYEVTIQPEKSYLVKGKSHYPIKPGMEVTADIISREETVLTFILRKARLLTDF